MYIFCILRLKAWQPKWYYFWRRLLIPIHSTLRVWYDISNFPSILLPLLYFIKGQEISKSNVLIFISFKKLAKFFLDFDLSSLGQNLILKSSRQILDEPYNFQINLSIWDHCGRSVNKEKFRIAPFCLYLAEIAKNGSPTDPSGLFLLQSWR